MEDYKEKYEQAMLRMNKWVEGSEIIEPKEVAEFVFPELRESKDDIMRKMAIHAVYSPEAQSCIKSWGVEPKDVIAWLEKQGESVMYDRDNYNSAKEKAWNCKSFDDDSNRKSIFMKGFQDGYQFGIHEEKPHRWTQHDEAVREEAVACLVDWKNKFPSIYSQDYRNVLDWLKEELSIHAEENQGVQKPAWSEEDEEVFHCLEYTVKHYYDDKDTINKYCSWLKSIKERYTWKPSDEQIKGIKCAIKTLQHQLNIGDKRLDALYDDLKKLKEK